MKNTISLISKGISIILHPLLIPTIGIILLFNSGFYFSLLTWEVKKFILIVVFAATCVLPLVTIILLAMYSRFDVTMNKSTDRVLPLMFSAIYYYVGYYLLGRLPIYPIYKLFLVSTILVIILLMVISMRWKISNHMASIGGLAGAILALSFRLQINTSLLLIAILFASGMLGTARLILKKHDPAQIYAGYALGFAVMFLILMII